MTTFIVAVVCWLLNRRRKRYVGGTDSVGNGNLSSDYLHDVGSDASEERQMRMMLDRWIRSDRESRWHVLQSGGFKPMALCEHVLRIDKHVFSVIADQPLYLDGCSICPNCLHLAAELQQEEQNPTKRAIQLEAALTMLESDHPIPWPLSDPDEDEGVPGSPYLPGTEGDSTPSHGKHAKAA